MCYHLRSDLAEKRGQLAHLDHNPANCREDNLAYLCLGEHHDAYDSTTRQSKNYTIGEVKLMRTRLYDALELRDRARTESVSAAPDANRSAARKSGHDARMLRVVLETLDLDALDYFFERAACFAVPLDTFHYVDGLRAVLDSTRFYIYHRELKKLVLDFGRSFLACFGYAEWFEPNRWATEYVFSRNVDANPLLEEKARRAFSRNVTISKRRLRLLIDHARSAWPSVDVDETTQTARRDKERFDGRTTGK